MRIIKEILNKTSKFFLFLLLIPLIILFIPFFIISNFIIEKRRKARLKAFCKQAAGSYFLIFSKRHNWYDFIKNNVMPVLPSFINTAWYEQNCNISTNNTKISIYDIPGLYGATKPLLLTVLSDHINIESLNNDFKELKQIKICKDEEIREKARIIIEKKLRNHNKYNSEH